MFDLFLRFLIGGTFVCLFALLGELFRPRSFAGLFGAAPSIALATLSITLMREGPAYAAIEARSMIFGAIAFFFYAVAVSYVLLRYHPSTLHTTIGLMPIWFAVAFGLWALFLR